MGITPSQYRQLLANRARADGRELSIRAHPKYRSKTEERYAGHLETLRTAGDLREWRYEPVTLVLAQGVRYTPDFLVRLYDGSANGALAFHEVKGRKADSFWSRPVGKVKVRVAAALFPWWEFRIVWPAGDGGWKSWRVEA